MKPESPSNRLIGEKSPYLLQHAGNPVDWHPWGEEAFARARREDKPVFLSVGYSTCHWCHVMAHESFEDPEVARLLNDALVCVKVDREERPDIDKVYMTVCQLLTGSGGWPLTIVMTPDKHPFFAATYIPRENRFGRVGMLELIPQIERVWKTRRDDVLSSTRQILAALRKTAREADPEDLSMDPAADAFAELHASFDETHGGFGPAPKFPIPHHLCFLLRFWKRHGSAEALRMAEKTLQAMRAGGLCDHLGFGFHRYSTDASWLVPHFEKMLYDQALLAIAYIEAFQSTGKDEYGRTAREILAYAVRDLTSPEGGFYSAEDADSEGEEGRFYLWTEAEIRRVLAPEEADFAVRFFHVQRNGNYLDEASGRKNGKNILHVKQNAAEMEPEAGRAAGEWEGMLERARRKLFEAREGRPRPHRDDKILTDWNGLMIAAFARAAAVFDDAAYLKAADRAADFLLQVMGGRDGGLLHRYREGQAAIPANLDDYAFTIWGLIELYEAGFAPPRLEAAVRLQEEQDRRFWDGAAGGYFFTPDDGEALLLRQKDIHDGAIPSGNAVSLLNVLRLARMTGRPDLEDRAARLVRAFSSQLRKYPSGHSHFLIGLDFLAGPTGEIVIAGDLKQQDAQDMLRSLRKTFLPNKVVIFRHAGEAASSASGLFGFADGMKAIDGRATAYVCVNYACSRPTQDSGEMLRLLDPDRVRF
ncbi:MAG: hypothetical protein A4E68_01462 [Syntrophaceae bacterium PtaB.Bin095]|nr:MAG: hypothetical protein A4E68_01462 [Syntrophaceae bacterium PtaB.Bin095]